MKTRYKILILVVIMFFIYWPGIPLVAIGCQSMTTDEICFDIASLRIPNPIPSSDMWDNGGNWK